MKYLLNPSLYVPFLTLISFELFARAGGGGGGSGGGGFGGLRHGSNPVGLLIILGIFFIQTIYYKFKISSRKKMVKKALVEMSTVEPEWSEGNLLKIATEHFFNLQLLWGNQDLEGLKKHLTHDLYLDWKLQIDEQIYKSERNPILNLVVQDSFIVAAKNYINNNNDLFVVCFDAQGDDRTLRHEVLVSSDRSAFREFWLFRRQMGEWKLYGIAQAEGWQKLFDGNIVFERMEKKLNL